MKILIICQHYYPEQFRITDICEELVKLGHDVTVVTGTPNYPMGEIYPGYEKEKRKDEIINGVQVHRCKIRPRKMGAINRLINYLSFPISANKYIMSLDDNFDVVFANQLSPVMMAEPAMLYKKRNHKKVVLYCMDLWPESLCVGGIRKGSFVYRVFGHISKKIYKGADDILITSKSFMNSFVYDFGIPKERINYLPQYAEEQYLKLGFKEPEEVFNVLFAGNIGMAQSLDTVIKAAEILKYEEPKIKFHIVGDGTEYYRIKEMAKDLTNVSFYGRRPVEEMPKYFGMADAMLVTLIADDAMSMIVPGKVQSYMAAAKPIVGAINGETQELLNELQGGYCCNAEDYGELARNIAKLANDRSAVELGKRNREYYQKNFSKEVFLDNLLFYLKKNV